MGTRFIATQEAPVHENVKKFIVSNDERSTRLIFRSFKNTTRVSANSVSNQVVEILRNPDAVFEDVRELVLGAKGRIALETGDLDHGLITAGQIQGLIHDIPTCAELVGRIVSEAEAIIARRLAGFMASGVPA
jgi:NAD(P)H-dependent flavin oxidoreductase YrpB (nitropropane dioxygenase family)